MKTSSVLSFPTRLIKRNAPYLLLSLCCCVQVWASDYYIDYESGKDSNSGTSKSSPWQHSPGDRAATDNAKACQLAPGDTVYFKGGVDYVGQIGIVADGTANKPITLDGNSDGSYGDGPAIIWGSEVIAVSAWKQCRNAEEAEGSEYWKDIVYADINGAHHWQTFHLHSRDYIYPIAQSPNLPDPFYQEMADHYHKAQGRMVEQRDFSIEPVDMSENAQRPLVMMFDGSGDGASGGGAVINDFAKGKVKVTRKEPAKIVSIGYMAQPRYSNPNRLEFDFDNGKTVLEYTPAPADATAKEVIYKLDTPIEFTELTVGFGGSHPNAKGKKNSWGAIRKIAAYDKDGNNVLLTDRASYLKHTEVFTQDDPNYWDGATVVIYGQPAMVYAQDVIDYNPAKKEVQIELFTRAQYSDGGAFTLMNSTRLMDQPGEYTVRQLGNGKTRIFLRPQHGLDGLRYGVYSTGLDINGSFITIKGIHTRGQSGGNGGVGITAGVLDKEGLIITGCDVGMVRGKGSAIYIRGNNNSLIENTVVHDNAGHTKGILARLLDGIIIRNCTLYRNTSTALDYYTLSNGAVLDCLLYDNQGMHANGLTFYSGCENILVDGNEVYDGNVGLTFQDGKNILIRNNILVSKHAFGIGIWAGKVYENIVIVNNIIEGADVDGVRKAGIYGGNPALKNLLVANNIIIGGFDGNTLHKAQFENNIFSTEGISKDLSLPGNNITVDDAGNLFIDADQRDYRLANGSVAIGAGLDLGAFTRSDKNGTQRTGAIDAGAYQHRTQQPGFAEGRAPQDMDGVESYAYKGPSLIGEDMSKPHFAHASKEPNVTVAAADFTAQTGGNLRVKEEVGSIFGWDNNGHTVEWVLDVPEAGRYEIVFNETTLAIAKRSFSINGQPIEELQTHSMTYTGSWRKFTDHYLPVAVELKAGTNTLTVENEGGSLNVMNIRAYKIK